MATLTYEQERKKLHEKWARILEEYDQSNLSGQRFCVAREIPYHQFVYHRQRVRASAGPPAGFKELAFTSSCGVGLRIGTVTVEVAPGFDPGLLRAVVSALA